jgi:hypothetical protein
MKIPGVAVIFLLSSAALLAQTRGAAVNSGGARAVPSAPAAQRSVGTVLNPAGAVPPVYASSPFINTSIPGRVGVSRGVRAPRSGAFLYPYPVYVGGGYGGGYYGSGSYSNGYYDSSYAGQPGYGQGYGQEQSPNVVVVYPQQQPPVIINQFGPGDPQMATRVQPQNLVYPPAPSQADEAPAAETSHYLIAFKDHSIYSAVAYWVDGDTLHYFTTPTTHNQASVSLVDRDLTDRLNKESGAEVKLPPAK